QVRREEQRSAVIAVVRWMVVALLLVWVHAIGDGRVEQGLDAVDTANEASAADKHHRMTARLLAGGPAAVRVPARDIDDLQVIAAKQGMQAEHSHRFSQMRTNVQACARACCDPRRGRTSPTTPEHQDPDPSKPTRLETAMASIRKEILIDASPDDVWAA